MLTLEERERRAYIDNDQRTLAALHQSEEELLDGVPTREEHDDVVVECVDAQGERDAAVDRLDGLLEVCREMLRSGTSLETWGQLRAAVEYAEA